MLKPIALEYVFGKRISNSGMVYDCESFFFININFSFVIYSFTFDLEFTFACKIFNKILISSLVIELTH